MVMNLPKRMQLTFVAYNLLVVISLVEVDALVYRRTIDEPLVKEQQSINSNGNNENVVSREVINHVRHQHQQTIGNVHILTNIDIANLITILNVSASNAAASATAATGQSTEMTPQSGKCLRKNFISLIMILSSEIAVAASNAWLTSELSQTSHQPNRLIDIKIHMIR